MTDEIKPVNIAGAAIITPEFPRAKIVFLSFIKDMRVNELKSMTRWILC